MIIDKHTPEQVVSEAFRDLPAMWNKLKEPLSRLQRNMRKDKTLRMVPQLLEYRSHAGNNWLVAVVPTKTALIIAPFVWYRGRDLFYRAARIMQDGVSYHISHHVLEQYSKRFNSTEDGLTRMKEFIRENMNFGCEHCLDNNEVRVGVTHGYITGTWVVPHQIAQLTTFVVHRQLYKEQLEQMDRLDQQRYENLRRQPLGPASFTKPWDLPRPSL